MESRHAAVSFATTTASAAATSVAAGSDVDVTALATLRAMFRAR